MLNDSRVDGVAQYRDSSSINTAAIEKRWLHNVYVVIIGCQGLVESRVIPATA